jgi:hypothetical protein
MGLKQDKQPELRFDLVGPNSLAGVSFVPKVITVTLDLSTGAGNYDFWTAPAGTLITRVDAVAEDAADGSATMELGTDGNADALIDTLDSFDPTSADAWATNHGSANADNPDGLFLPAGDVLRATIGGTPTTGTVRLVIQYFELDAMFLRGVHLTA